MEVVSTLKKLLQRSRWKPLCIDSNAYFASTDQVMGCLNQLCSERDWVLMPNIILTCPKDISFQAKDIANEFRLLSQDTKYAIIVANGSPGLDKEAHQNIFILDIPFRRIIRCEPMGYSEDDTYYLGRFCRSLGKLIDFKIRYAYHYDINDTPACRVTSLILALMYLFNLPFVQLNKIDHYGEIALRMSNLLIANKYISPRRKRKRGLVKK